MLRGATHLRRIHALLSSMSAEEDHAFRQCPYTPAPMLSSVFPAAERFQSKALFPVNPAKCLLLHPLCGIVLIMA